MDNKIYFLLETNWTKF